MVQKTGEDGISLHNTIVNDFLPRIDEVLMLNRSPVAFVFVS